MNRQPFPQSDHFRPFTHERAVALSKRNEPIIERPEPPVWAQWIAVISLVVMIGCSDSPLLDRFADWIGPHVYSVFSTTD